MDKAEINQRVTKVADMLELGPLLDRKPKQLSGGQRQRVAMGRAIVREPQVFLMDEPLSNLDAKLRVQMRSEIAQVQHDLDVTTIYVTHDQTEAMTMGDRVAVMKAGILQEVGDPQYLYDNPANIFVAGFIGSPPMNLAVGKVVRPDGNGDLAVRLGSATIRLHPAVAQQRPGLAAYVSKDVAVGIRSEDMEDARLVRDAPADTRLKATVSLVEALGAQIVVHFDVDAPKVVTADTKLLEKDAHTDDAPTHRDRGDQVRGLLRPPLPGQDRRPDRGGRGHRTHALLRPRDRRRHPRLTWRACHSGAPSGTRGLTGTPTSTGRGCGAGCPGTPSTGGPTSPSPTPPRT